MHCALISRQKESRDLTVNIYMAENTEGEVLENLKKDLKENTEREVLENLKKVNESLSRVVNMLQSSNTGEASNTTKSVSSTLLTKLIW